MRILYAAPRFHSNQIPVVEGWKANGHEVCFITQMTNASENHQVLKPIVLGYSRLSRLILSLVHIIKNCTTEDQKYAVDTKLGWPPALQVYKLMGNFNPDLVVLRERSMYSLVVYRICKKLHIPAILYNQSPYLIDDKQENLVKAFIKGMFPKVRMTPVYSKLGYGILPDKNAVFVPFVMPIGADKLSKVHFLNDKINIVCVSGYHERKKLTLLLEAFKRLENGERYTLTFAGEVISKNQQDYYDNLYKEAQTVDNADIKLLKNVSREEVFNIYRNSDLFVMPSTREAASISQLEAMSCAVPIICSDTNGCAFQVTDGVNGYRFINEDADSLYDVLQRAVSDREKLVHMGEEAWDYVSLQCNFDKYYEGIIKCLKMVNEK